MTSYYHASSSMLGGRLFASLPFPRAPVSCCSFHRFPSIRGCSSIGMFHTKLDVGLPGLPLVVRCQSGTGFVRSLVYLLATCPLPPHWCSWTRTLHGFNPEVCMFSLAVWAALVSISPKLSDMDTTKSTWFRKATGLTLFTMLATIVEIYMVVYRNSLDFA